MTTSDTKKLEAVRLNLANLAVKRLWQIMGRPGDVPWWLLDIGTSRDARGGPYTLVAVINGGVELGDDNWPYGLPQHINGFRVTFVKKTPPAGYIDPTTIDRWA